MNRKNAQKSTINVAKSVRQAGTEIEGIGSETGTVNAQETGTETTSEMAKSETDRPSANEIVMSTVSGTATDHHRTSLRPSRTAKRRAAGTGTCSSEKTVAQDLDPAPGIANTPRTDTISMFPRPSLAGIAMTNPRVARSKSRLTSFSSLVGNRAFLT